jgi:hypothetical protein
MMALKLAHCLRMGFFILVPVMASSTRFNPPTAKFFGAIL